mmetsp:Transcript_12449/g.29541  ORF Transcript_12449/g.29541 Transcript_12449/m.29541 type:complete len:114 (+) Transcript_12449:137-478(+)
MQGQTRLCTEMVALRMTLHSATSCIAVSADDSPLALSFVLHLPLQKHAHCGALRCYICRMNVVALQQPTKVCEFLLPGSSDEALMCSSFATPCWVHRCAFVPLLCIYHCQLTG